MFSKTQSIIKCLLLFQIWLLTVAFLNQDARKVHRLNLVMSLCEVSSLVLWHLLKQLNCLRSILFQILYLIISLWHCLTYFFNSCTSCKLGLNPRRWIGLHYFHFLISEEYIINGVLYFLLPQIKDWTQCLTVTFSVVLRLLRICSFFCLIHLL